MSGLKKGFIQVYTGNGKGKTTAALGQAIRSSGSGMKSLIIQFMKDFPYGELRALKSLEPLITIEQYGNDTFVLEKRPPEDKEKEEIQRGLKRAQDALLSGEYDLVILDEICVCFYFGLLNLDDVMPLLSMKPENVELILTGRYCPEEILDMADLVTDMREIKHYYRKGITSRKGIEC
ncbi:MAG: cob(I)yrinic acid a,c-diamide adenosyltransferase [Bacteroidota bacterium]|jgi:cob(I)alamin adenosyltransferase|nr:cob(I)yrinic acid a,c-diamide adenosyltransferase [Ignavibacteria bacterium]MCU7498628.1 cob(I)yrinic acid a,c-diamide adenosyltransferase [Ignavibacteria bacterium]MCU7512468.1 cob(I)yrinic acid a,c-diamide adenosyltransferase [Ignavibacteria bacterium]MCU7522518.1 cob(I)yrinic acid a,c-diamide adenosyltransferase [Ignavibacteria bacterium]MCU7523613.1 cob(I)yrinic acid a,c-diamide adenosyltransferase [Ignavibacteria bacterium]